MHCLAKIWHCIIQIWSLRKEFFHKLTFNNQREVNSIAASMLIRLWKLQKQILVANIKLRYVALNKLIINQIDQEKLSLY